MVSDEILSMRRNTFPYRTTGMASKSTPAMTRVISSSGRLVRVTTGVGGIAVAMVVVREANFVWLQA